MGKKVVLLILVALLGLLAYREINGCFIAKKVGNLYVPPNWLQDMESRFGAKFVHETKADSKRIELIRQALLKNGERCKSEKIFAIPHRLHTIWLEKEMPAAIEDAIASWKNLHPQWELKVWRKSDLLHLPGEILTLPKMLMRDLAAATVLEEQGGIYFDAEVEALQPLDSLLMSEQNRSFMCGIEPPLLKPYKSHRVHFSPIVVGATPDNAIAKKWKKNLLLAASKYTTNALQSQKIQKKIAIEAFGESVDWGLKCSKEHCFLVGPDCFCPINPAGIALFLSITSGEAKQGKFRHMLLQGIRGQFPYYLFPSHRSYAYHQRGGRLGV